VPGNVLEPIVAALLILSSQPLTQANEAAPILSNADRAIVFAVRLEAHANQFEARKDVCVSFDTRMKVDKKGIRAELKREKLRVHADDWCLQGPRGVVIFVRGAIGEVAPETYELEVEASDWWPIKREGAHFATLLRRGTYSVKCKDASRPELVRYQGDALTQTPRSKP
jgi:hypothetical protein